MLENSLNHKIVRTLMCEGNTDDEATTKGTYRDKGQYDNPKL